MEIENATGSSMEIYIHIPFCVKKCDYCDFLSGPSCPKERAEYVQALLAEIDAVKEGVYPLYLLEGALLLFWMRDSLEKF